MTQLLLHEAPLVVIPELAVHLGLNEAIIVQQIHYWLQKNEREQRNQVDGYTWTYNTYEQWTAQFPFWSRKTVQRVISGLVTADILITANFNKSKMDHTKWYRINYPRLHELTADQASVRKGHVDQITASTQPLEGTIERDTLTSSMETQDACATGHLDPMQEDTVTCAIPETNAETYPEISPRHIEPHEFEREKDRSATMAPNDPVASIGSIVGPLLQRSTLDPDEVRMVTELLAAGVSVACIVQGIQASFAAYVPRRPGDRIYKLTYCRARILKEHGTSPPSRPSPSLVQKGKYDRFYALYPELQHQGGNERS